MSTNQEESNGATRVAYLLGVPLADERRAPVAADG